MKIFISQGLRGKDNPQEYVALCRKKVQHKYPFAVLIDSILPKKEFPSEKETRIWYLSQSIAFLGQADLAVFMDDWNQYDGCLVEHLVCQKYGVKIDYLSTQETPSPIFKDFEIEEIRKMIQEGVTRDTLSEKYSISSEMASNILQYGRVIK